MIVAKKHADGRFLSSEKLFTLKIAKWRPFDRLLCSFRFFIPQGPSLLSMKLFALDEKRELNIEFKNDLITQIIDNDEEH